MDFSKILQPLMLEWLDQLFPNFFERDPMSLVSTSRVSSFLISTMYSFLTHLHYRQTRRQAVVTLNIYNSALDRLGATLF